MAHRAEKQLKLATELYANYVKVQDALSQAPLGSKKPAKEEIKAYEKTVQKMKEKEGKFYEKSFKTNVKESRKTIERQVDALKSGPEREASFDMFTAHVPPHSPYQPSMGSRLVEQESSPFGSFTSSTPLGRSDFMQPVNLGDEGEGTPAFSARPQPFSYTPASTGFPTSFASATDESHESDSMVKQLLPLLTLLPPLQLLNLLIQILMLLLPLQLLKLLMKTLMLKAQLLPLLTLLPPREMLRKKRLLVQSVLDLAVVPLNTPIRLKIQVM